MEKVQMALAFRACRESFKQSEGKEKKNNSELRQFDPAACLWVKKSYLSSVPKSKKS